MSGQSGKRKFTTKQAVAYFFESNAWKIIQEQQDELISLGDAVAAQYVTAMESNSHHKTAGGKKKNKRRKNRTRKMTGGTNCSQETKCGGADGLCDDLCDDDGVTYTCSDTDICIPSINAAGDNTLTPEQIKELQNSQLSKRLYAKWGILFCIIAAFCANLAMSDDDMWETIQFIWSMLSMEYIKSTDMYREWVKCTHTERFEASRALDIFQDECHSQRFTASRQYSIQTMMWAGTGGFVGGLAGLAIGGPGLAWYGFIDGTAKGAMLASALTIGSTAATAVSGSINIYREHTDPTERAEHDCMILAREAYKNVTSKNNCASRDATGYETPWALIMGIIALEYQTNGIVSKSVSFLGKKGNQGFDKLADFIVNIFDSVTCQKPLNAEQNRVLGQWNERMNNANQLDKKTMSKAIELLKLQLANQSRGLAASYKEELDYMAIQRTNRTERAKLRMKQVKKYQDLLKRGFEFTTKQLTDLQKRSTAALTAARDEEAKEKAAKEKAAKEKAAGTETKRGGKRKKKSRKKKSRKQKSKQKKTTHKRRN